MNISHSEYNDKYTEYLKAVHRREAREAIGSGAALYSKKLYSFATTSKYYSLYFTIHFTIFFTRP